MYPHHMKLLEQACAYSGTQQSALLIFTVIQPAT
jgi:hypothetical protein